MSNEPFDRLGQIQEDPIFRVNNEAKAAGPDALNGTVGMLFDEEGNVAMLPSVRSAVERVNAERNGHFGYPPLTGLPSYREHVTRLLGADGYTVASAGTTGGTGALSMNARILKHAMPDIPLVLPVPAWPNHAGIFREAGLDVQTVAYLESGNPSIDHMIHEITRRQCVVLLQNACHNPTGLDLSHQQWKDLAVVMAKNGSMAMIDAAYQGFGDEPDHDVPSLHHMIEQGVPSFIGWSAAKNHTIYSERVGLAAAVVPDAPTKKLVESHYAVIARSIHSATATFGQRVVATVQEHFRDDWLSDLRDVRSLLTQKRTLLTSRLPDQYTAALSGAGLFAQLPVDASQIQRLKAEKKVFLADDGRINIGGIPLARIEELASSINDITG